MQNHKEKQEKLKINNKKESLKFNCGLLLILSKD